MRLVFIVDDNLIGNKTAVKDLLRRVVDWQREQGYPMTFYTQATLDLAEDEELLRLMGEANIQCVFIGGLPTPSRASNRGNRRPWKAIVQGLWHIKTRSYG